MIIDKYTKAVLTLIAISLFVISLNPWIAPTKAYADIDSYDVMELTGALSKIESAIRRIHCSS